MSRSSKGRTRPTRWGPLLRGKVAREARATIAALSESFLRLRPAALPGVSLWEGPPGLALVHDALDRVRPRLGHDALAERALALAIARAGRTTVAEGLTGLAGVGWTIAHLVGGEDGDACAVFDAELERVLGRARRTRSFDLIQGLVGVGVYALEGAARPAGRRLVGRVVNELRDRAEERPEGLVWWSDPGWLRARRRGDARTWNLGVAHGVPGVIALLGRIAAADVDDETRATARTLLQGAVPWLLAQRLGDAEEGCFPLAIGRGEPRAPARLAWCYGDPGIAAALLVAARGAGEPAWERAALRVALRAASRAESRAGVEDAGLCHGAAGVAHIFHRLYRATGEERLAAASRAWFGRALAMRAPGRASVAGFAARAADAAGRPRWKADAGFLSGAAGVGLALIAATSEEEPGWDRALLVSL